VNISTKAWTVGYKIVGAAIVLMVLSAIILVSVNNAQLRAENQAMYADLQASQSNSQELYEQLLDEGIEPEGEAPEEVAPPPVVEKPKDGDDGKDGEDGAAGPPPTDAQVYAAVQQCFTTGVCVAPKGDPGTNGTNGQDAPAPTAEQMLAAMQQCFASGVCVAPKGDQGAPGPAGPTCPDGYTPTTVWMTVSDEEAGIPRQQQAIACLPITTEGEPSS
jgi:hypothetical protein